MGGHSDGSRRAFLGQAATGLGVAGVLSLGGCATLRGAVPAAPPDPARYLADLDAQLRAIRGAPVPEPVAVAVERAALPPGVVHDALTSLQVAGAFRDAPAELQRESALQERVWDHSARMGRQALVLGSYLDGLDDDTRRRIGCTLSSRPELEREMRAALTDAAVECGLGAARADQVDLFARVLARELRTGEQGPMLDRVCRRLEVAAAGCGVPRDGWRQHADLALDLDPAEAARVVSALERERQATSSTGAPRRFADHDASAKVASVGLIVMGVSGLTTLVGVGMNTGMNWTGMYVMTAGAVIAVIGLVILAVAGVVALGELAQD